MIHPTVENARIHQSDSASTMALLFLLSALFLPLLADWGRHLAEYSWTWYSLAFPPLLAVVVGRGKQSHRRTVSAFVFTTLGLMAMVWAEAANALRYARPAFLLCGAAILLLDGRIRWRCTPLIMLCLPLPTFVMRGVADFVLPVVATALTVVAPGAEAYRGSGCCAVTFSTSTFALAYSDTGLASALLASGLWWGLDLLRPQSTWTALWQSAVAGAVGMLAHFFVTAGWVALSGAPRPDAAVRDLVAFVVVALGVLAAHARYIDRLDASASTSGNALRWRKGLSS